jgi:tetratricopeptide (TPR) repeat protein
VKATIGRRLTKAGETCRRVLTVAAVVGREFNPDVLVAVSQLQEDEVLDALDEGSRLQLIRETKVGRGTGYAFEHALIRQTLYESLNARRRARLHQQVGEAVERMFQTRLDDYLEELAYHFGEAGVPPANKGIDYNIRAAEKASRLYALEEGVRRLSVALELAQALGEPVEEVRVHVALGDLYRAFAENKEAGEAFQRALDLVKQHAPVDEEGVLSLSLRLAESIDSFGTSQAPQAGAAAQEAVQILRPQGEQPILARALALLAMQQVRLGDLPAARGHAQEAIALAERLGAQDELRMAYRAMAWVHRSSNEWPQFRGMVQKHHSLRGAGFTAADVNLHVDLVQSLLSGGNYAEAERAAREFLALGEKLRSPTAIFHACQWLATVLFSTNRWDEALELTRRARGVGERLRGADFLLGWFLRREAWIVWARGEEDEARRLIGRIEALQYDVPPAHQGARQQALELAMRIGDLGLIRRLIPRVEEEKPHCLTCTLEFHVSLGTARLALGDRESGEKRLRAAEEVLPANPEPEFLAGLAWLRAHIAEASGDLDEAVQHAEEYLRLLAGQPMWLEQALMWQDAARMHLRRGRPEDISRGRDLLGEVLPFYEKVGAKKPEMEARAMLASVEG